MPADIIQHGILPGRLHSRRSVLSINRTTLVAVSGGYGAADNDCSILVVLLAEMEGTRAGVEKETPPTNQMEPQAWPTF